jgi:hypothetical protein
MQKQSMQQKEDALSGVGGWVVGWDQTYSLFYFMLLKKLFVRFCNFYFCLEGSILKQKQQHTQKKK